MKKKLIAGVAAVALIIAVAAYNLYQRSGNGKGEVRVSGNIEATTVEVSFKIPGRVAERMVDEGNTAAAAQVKAHAEASVGRMLDQLDAQLAAHGQDWLLGATFSAVDPFVLMLCRWTRGFARPARRLPHVGPYLQRVLARPAVQRAFATEKLAPPLV